jgi:uncharacterized protein (UPF0218 family)
VTDVPIRSSTLDAIGAAEWHLSHLRTALEHELGAVYAEIDRLRVEMAKVKKERDDALLVVGDLLAEQAVKR